MQQQKNNNGQSNLAIGGIAANWGAPTLKSSLSMGSSEPLSNTMLLGSWDHTSVRANGISFRPTALAGCPSVTDDIYTNGQTDRPRYGNMCGNLKTLYCACISRNRSRSRYRNGMLDTCMRLELTGHDCDDSFLRLICSDLSLYSSEHK